jgi:hypothetical protein
VDNDELHQCASGQLVGRLPELSLAFADRSARRHSDRFVHGALGPDSQAEEYHPSVALHSALRDMVTVSKTFCEFSAEPRRQRCQMNCRPVLVTLAHEYHFAVVLKCPAIGFDHPRKHQQRRKRPGFGELAPAGSQAHNTGASGTLPQPAAIADDEAIARCLSLNEEDEGSQMTRSTASPGSTKTVSVTSKRLDPLQRRTDTVATVA